MSFTIETSILGRLFPRPPSKNELKNRRKANSRFIVGQVSTGSYLLQKSRYMTEEDIEKKRRLVLSNK
jgi:hypothetical protein